MAVKRKAKKIYYLTLMEMVILLANLHIAAKDEDIGYGECTKSIRRLNHEISRLVKRFPITEHNLESCLWACNMLDEKEQFWQPWIKKNRMTFPLFVKSVIHRYEYFDRFHNDIRKKANGPKSDS